MINLASNPWLTSFGVLYRPFSQRRLVLESDHDSHKLLFSRSKLSTIYQEICAEKRESSWRRTKRINRFRKICVYYCVHAEQVTSRAFLLYFRSIFNWNWNYMELYREWRTCRTLYNRVASNSHTSFCQPKVIGDRSSWIYRCFNASQRLIRCKDLPVSHKQSFLEHFDLLLFEGHDQKTTLNAWRRAYLLICWS